MKHALTEMFQLYKPCVVRITVRTAEGDLATGTGFHIGEGYIVTASHVIDGGKLVEIVGCHYADHHDQISLRRILRLSRERADVVVLETDFALTYFMDKVQIMVGGAARKKVDHIPLGGHLNDWLDDGFTLSKVLLMGFPPIPLTNEPVLLGASAEVNAVIDPRHTDHPCFIVSAMPRGGFSGGPAISEYGMLLGVVTESLHAGEHSELGFASVMSIEPILGILLEHRVYPVSQKATLEMLFGTPLP